MEGAFLPPSPHELGKTMLWSFLAADGCWVQPSPGGWMGLKPHRGPPLPGSLVAAGLPWVPHWQTNPEGPGPGVGRQRYSCLLEGNFRYLL